MPCERSGASVIPVSEEVLHILHRDDHLVAVDKPAGWLVHRSPIDRMETRFCVQLLRDQLGQPVYPCHRLDKPTSGVLLFALDTETLKAVNAAFAAHEVRKTYHAIVRGWMDDSGTIDHPLKAIVEGGHARGGGPAVTQYRTRQHFQCPFPVGPHPTARYSLVELHPLTGRMHQLRRHLKHLHHPIIGDTRYGDGTHNRLFREHYSCHRLLLHATRLELKHPVTGERLEIATHPQACDFGIPLPVADGLSKEQLWTP